MNRPAAVIASCVTDSQVAVAHRYAKLWLRFNGLGSKSHASRKLNELVYRRHIQILFPDYRGGR